MNSEKLEEMKENTKKFAKPKAAEDICKLIFEL